MFDVGRLCVKTAGRDAGKHCVVVEVVDENFVLVDGETRRRKVNVKHLEPLGKMVELGGTSHADVKVAFEKLGMKVLETKKKEKKEKPRKVRKGKKPTEKKKAPVKKAEVKKVQNTDKAEEEKAEKADEK